MSQTPCEYILWNLLSVIRHEIAKSMVNDFGLNQKEAAAKLEITPAAVSMYLSDKRGKSNLKNENILKEIKISAQNIIQYENKNLVESSKIIYIHRDGRDVLTSLYFYAKKYRSEITEMSFSDFIRMDNDFDGDTYQKSLNRIEYWKFHVSNWFKVKNSIIF